MTSREQFLLTVLGITALAGAGLWGWQSYLDDSSRLDQRFASLQKEALQLQSRVLQPNTSTKSGLEIGDRLWPHGQLPEPLSLARLMKPVLESSGVLIKEFQVLEASEQGFTLKYTLDASAPAFLGALVGLQTKSPRLITRAFSATAKEHALYSFAWEVGYSVAP